MPCHTDDHIMFIQSTHHIPGTDYITIWHKCLDCPKVETEWRRMEEEK